MSTPIGNQGAYARKRPRPQTNPPKKQTNSFAFRRFSSGLSSPSLEPLKVESPALETEETGTKEKDPESQKSCPLHSKPIKTEGHECQNRSPLHSKPIRTEGTFNYTKDSRENHEKLKYLAPLLISCQKSVSPVDAEEVNQLKLDQLWKKSVSLTLNAVYCQEVAKDRIGKVFDEMNRLITERNTLGERIAGLQTDLDSERSQAREEKARTELEKIKVEQVKKRAAEDKVRADSLAAQAEESRKALSEEVRVTKAALEEEKSKVSKLTVGVSAREVAAVEAFKQSKDFRNLMFEQFASGYDDCRSVILENHPGLDLSWMDAKE